MPDGSEKSIENRPVARRTILRAALTGGVFASLGAHNLISAPPAHAYTTATRAEHDALPISWGFPFDHRVDYRKGVDGYPGATYSDHKGLDYYPSQGSGVEIYSVADGTVDVVGTIASNDLGCYVRVAHTSGVYSYYAHMTPNSQVVSAGQQVKRGQLLGLTGWTGYIVPKEPENAHLHLSIQSNPGSNPKVWNPVWLVDDAPLANGDQMPTYIAFVYTANQTVPTSFGTFVKMDSDVTNIATRGIVSAVANLEFSDLDPGAIVQARFVHTNSSGGDVTTLGAVEIWGTSGSTYGQISAIIDLENARRLRLQVMGPSGVKLTSVKLRATQW